ncbi:SDR family oxidoreductase [Propioniciclava soli]|uniref:SDR family oxidoreductase n=1 Tax=Propioniciclava soli TaxID=2775081 RepID=A0ABZ3CB67_9ACTN
MKGLDQDRVFLITGGIGGIGLGVAQTLLEYGSRVVVTDVVGEEGADEVARLGAGDRVRYVDLDVTDPEAAESVADQLEADGWPVFGLMANAGVAPTSPTVDYPDDTWRTTVDINLNGVFWTVRSFGRRMVERGEGAIILTSSIAGLRVVSPETHVAYGATKAAVAHMASLLGVEWAKEGVRVNALAPGYTDTSILDAIREESPETIEEWKHRTPLGRLIQPEEIGQAAAFLFSDLASGITATTLSVDGGYAAR